MIATSSTSDIEKPLRITVTLAGLPGDFKAEDRYGLHPGLEPGSYENRGRVRRGFGRRAIHHRGSYRSIARGADGRSTMIVSMLSTDPLTWQTPSGWAPIAWGPYAERHLGWGRTSVLTRIGEAGEGYSLQLAEAGRAARTAFMAGDQGIFKSRRPGRGAEQAIRRACPREISQPNWTFKGVSITSGGIALHDGNLPLRRLELGPLAFSCPRPAPRRPASYRHRRR